MVTKYKVEFLPEAISDLKKLDRVICQRIMNKIRWLADNFESITPEILAGDFKGMFELRIGDWRVVYTAEYKLKIIRVHMVGHRREIYNIRK
jgi:mRNA interferase RelE/StbE